MLWNNFKGKEFHGRRKFFVSKTGRKCQFPAGNLCYGQQWSTRCLLPVSPKLKLNSIRTSR
jgi:hypothetical protein